MRVVIDGTPLTFRTNGGKSSVGLSDTLWYTADHFSLCNHLDGLRAVIQYSPSSGSGISGDLVRFEIDDDLVLPPARSSIR